MKPRCAALSTARRRALSGQYWSGPKEKSGIRPANAGLDISGFEIVDAPHSEAAAAKGVELIHAAKGEMLMKGSLHTDELMRSVTAKVGGAAD